MNNKWIRHLRTGLLALFTLLITTASYLHITQGGGKAPSIHALCPYGGLESAYQLFSSGTLISKIFMGTITLFVITLLLAFLFRRSFCGLICPFGAIQELFGFLGRKIFRRQLYMPAPLDRILRYLKYLVLLITIYYAWKTAGLWMAPYDPWSAYAHLPEGLDIVWAESAGGLVLLGITLVGSMLYDRFFCKYLCPMGAVYGIWGKISPFRIKRNENLCVDCGKCSSVCPMTIDVQHLSEVTSAECIQCQLCVLDCPKKGALENHISKKPMQPLHVLALVLILFFGSIFAAQAAGIYPLLPEQPKAGDTLDFSEIKGYMSIEDAAKYTQTELHAFYALFGIPESVSASTMMKEISQQVPGFDFDAVKASFDTAEPSAIHEEGSEAVAVDVASIRGSMTIQEAADALSMDLTEFQQLFRVPEGVPTSTRMKDIGTVAPGYDFHSVKESLE